MKYLKLFENFNDDWEEPQDEEIEHDENFVDPRENTEGELIDGELIDTYGGDYTWRDVRWAFYDGRYHFYETRYGAKDLTEFEIDSPDEISEYERMLKKE